MNDKPILLDIDWLTCVFPDGWRLQPLDQELPLSAWRPRNGGYGYNRGLIDDITGTTMLWSADRKGMGTCYILPGKTLSKIASLLDTTSYLFAVSRLGFDLADATRIDVRMDIQDNGDAAHDFAKAVDQGACRCKARRRYIYRGTQGTPGLTVYLGSKASSSYVRVYDKAAESKGIKPYTRVEVQCRSERARRAWNALSKVDGNLQAGEHIKRIIASHIEFFGVPILDGALLGSTPFDFKVDRDVEKDTWRWLMAQVMPTFVRDAIVHRGDPQLWRSFSDELHKRLHPE